LCARGWRLTETREEADFIFFNTCSIRAKAAQRALKRLEELRPLKKNNPGLIIGLGGCLAEQEGRALFDQAPWLDLVAGPQHLPRLPDILDEILAGRGQVALTGAGEIPAWSQANLEAQGAAEPGALNPAAAPLFDYVTIMQGCDNYCAYCVVPYLRGPELSRPAGEIVSEIKGRVAAGARDITLLGQNVNAYGRGRAAGEPDFPELLRLAAATGLDRLRFITSHPRDFSPELVNLFGSLSPLSESLHLPVQSGSDAVLNAMGRGYTRRAYLDLVESLRARCPDLALTTDIIVGFPGETEADFDETLSLIETVGFDAMFSFKYSDRPGTAAASLAGKAPEEEKSRRLTELQTRQKAITLAKNSAHLGTALEVLVERVSSRYPGQLTGRARNYKLVHFDGPPELVGQLVPVRITGAFAASLRGERVEVGR
jgi:tRNA-2-methylthio-N6-dimethylallyladenosine synthase